MANVDSPFGLRPLRYKTGAPYNGAAEPMYILSTDTVALFVGDPVVKQTGGSNTAQVEAPGLGVYPIGTLPTIAAAAAGDSVRITGVIVGFAATASDLSKQYSPASTAGVALVATDPDLVYEIQADGAIPAASMGLNANIIKTHSGSTTTGISGVELDTTSDAPAADASNQLLIVRAVPREDNDTTITHAKVEVMINRTTDNPGSSGTLGI